MELDKSCIRLPRLAGKNGVPLARALFDASIALYRATSDAATKAIVTALAPDPRWSESERRNHLSTLCDAALKELAPLGEVAASIQDSAAEAENDALRAAIGKFEGARLLAIQQSLSSGSHEQRMSTVMRALAGDAESCAAIVSAPRELSILDGIDERVIDGLRDRLIDEELRTTCAATKFAVARLRLALQNSVDVLRRLTNSQAPMERRIVVSLPAGRLRPRVIRQRGSAR